MALRRLEGIDAPAIYLGGLSAARNEAELRAAAVTHVVDLTASGIDYEGFRHRGVRYLRIDLQDQPRADLAVHLPRINDFVNMARKKHGASVLLHCSSGSSRSAAAVAAYLVEHCAMTLQRALEVCACATKLCINVGFLSQLADFEVATMLHRIDRRVPRPSELTLKSEREQVRTTIDLTELAVDQLMVQYEDGFLCRGMPQEVFTRDLCRAALEERPITEAGLVDAMMCLEQQNRRSSKCVREADLAAYEKLRAEANEKQKRREQREMEAIREGTGEELDGSVVAAPVDLLAEDAEEKDAAIAKLRVLKTREDIDAQIELDVAEMAAAAKGSEVRALHRQSLWSRTARLHHQTGDWRALAHTRRDGCTSRLQMTSTQLFLRKQEERDVAKMKEEARRLEEHAAAQAARRQGEEQRDADDAAGAGAEDTESAVDSDGAVAVEKLTACTPELDGAVHSDASALAMRRKVEREREAAALKIQQVVRR